MSFSSRLLGVKVVNVKWFFICTYTCRLGKVIEVGDSRQNGPWFKSLWQLHSYCLYMVYGPYTIYAIYSRNCAIHRIYNILYNIYMVYIALYIIYKMINTIYSICILYIAIYIFNFYQKTNIFNFYQNGLLYFYYHCYSQ